MERKTFEELVALGKEDRSKLYEYITNLTDESIEDAEELSKELERHLVDKNEELKKQTGKLQKIVKELEDRMSEILSKYGITIEELDNSVDFDEDDNMIKTETYEKVSDALKSFSDEDKEEFGILIEKRLD